MTATDTPILIFDGECGLCSASVRWLRSRWRDGQAPTLLAAQSVSDEQLRQWSLDRGDLEQAAWWIAPGDVRRGHLAVARALSKCDGLAGAVGRVALHRPGRWLAALIYPVVARNRHLFSRGAAMCRVPNAGGPVVEQATSTSFDRLHVSSGRAGRLDGRA